MRLAGGLWVVAAVIALLLGVSGVLPLAPFLLIVVVLAGVGIWLLTRQRRA